jgi:hypothetical protein
MCSVILYWLGMRSGEVLIHRLGDPCPSLYTLKWQGYK